MTARTTKLLTGDCIRAVLSNDPIWALYALGDLAPEFESQCEWYIVSEPEAAALLIYHGFTPPVLFLAGPALAASELLSQCNLPAEVFFHVKAEHLSVLSFVYPRHELTPMRRMYCQQVKMPIPDESRPITPAELPELERLYAQRQPGEGHYVFFLPKMVAAGCYRGMWRERELVAVGGTHLLNRVEKVAAIGNVFVAPGWRNRGLGGAVTAAVTADLLRQGYELIGLNVSQVNIPAQRAYERIGFAVHCDYVEGLAWKGGATITDREQG